MFFTYFSSGNDKPPLLKTTLKSFVPEPETLYEKGNRWPGGWSLNPNDLHLLLFTGNSNSAGHFLC